MMLRVSSTIEGVEANLKAVTLGNAEDSGVRGQAELLALVDATLDPQPGLNQPPRLSDAQLRIAEQLGDAALVEAAAVIGNFERMTRIADGTGIPLDEPVAAMTAELREELGINEFSSAAYTPKVGWLKKTLFKLLAPLVMKRMGRQMGND